MTGNDLQAVRAWIVKAAICREELNEAWREATAIRSPQYGFGGVKVSESRPVEAIYFATELKVKDLDRKFQKAQALAIDGMLRLERELEMIDDPRIRVLLRYRVSFVMSWNQIAARMGLKLRSIYRLYDQALEALESVQENKLSAPASSAGEDISH